MDIFMGQLHKHTFCLYTPFTHTRFFTAPDKTKTVFVLGTIMANLTV